MHYSQELKLLEAKVRELNLDLILQTETPELDKINFRKIHVRTPTREFQFVVEDEFEDAHPDNPLILLQLVLQCCDDYTDAEDFLKWAKMNSLDSSDPHVLSLFRETANNVPAFLALVGKVVRISDWDMQMNAGAALELRSLSN